MSEPFLSEIKIVAFNFPPKGWAFCNGQLLPINQNQALFSLLGTTYGGNGQTNFALPNLRGRMPIHVGGGFTQGQAAGAVNHTLTMSEMPAHTHFTQTSTLPVNAETAQGNYFGAYIDSTPYAAGGSPTTLNPGSVTSAGGSQPHTNMPPYLVLTFIIALQGIFPSQN